MLSNSEPISHLRNYLPMYSRLALLWLSVGIIFYTFCGGSEGSFPVFFECFKWMYWGAGIVLLLFVIAEIWLQATTARRFPVNDVTAISVVMVCGLGLFFLGPRYGFLMRFYLSKPYYDETAKRLSDSYPSGQPYTFYYDDQSAAIVDQGPPIRVAIQLPGGLLDNFQAVVYDPSGVVGQLQRFDGVPHWDDPQLNELKGLFGGEMIYCEPIEGPWFYCWFT